MGDVENYIAGARKNGLDDESIKESLISSGWPSEIVSKAFGEEKATLSPPPYMGVEGHTLPVAVVQTLSTRGLEYHIMFSALFISSIATGLLLNYAITKFIASSTADADWWGLTFNYMVSALIVSTPIFFWLFARLKKAESSDSSLRSDPARKSSIQSVLKISFVIGIIHVITYVYALISMLTHSNNEFVGSTGGNILEITLRLIVTLVIAGGIFWYYWSEEHRSVSVNNSPA